MGYGVGTMEIIWDWDRIPRSYHENLRDQIHRIHA